MKKRECIVCKSKFEVKKEDVYQVEDINGVSEMLFLAKQSLTRLSKCFVEKT